MMRMPEAGSDPTLVLGGAGAATMVREAAAREANGLPVVHLEIGEPTMATPPHVVDAAVDAMRRGETRYGPPAGTPELRAAIARHQARRGVAAKADDVVVTVGAKSALFNAILACVRPGDQVLVPDPGYPSPAAVVRYAGGTPVPYTVRPAPSPALHIGDIARSITPRTRALVLNSPHNPTGALLDTFELDRLAALAREHDLLVISDEIYSEHVYDRAHESIASRPGMIERTVLVDGFSKAYAMTGWRLGYAVLPSSRRAGMMRLLVHSTTCVPTFVQRAGVAALTGPQDATVAQRDEMRAKRDWLVAALNEIPGVRCAPPRGAFYAFVDVREMLETAGETDEQLAMRLLREYGIATVPGSAFGAGGAGHIRISYAASEGDLKVALEALAACGSGTGANAGGVPRASSTSGTHVSERGRLDRASVRV